MRKNPVVAAVLNFFFWGGGTMYVGKRMGFGLAMSIGGTLAQAVEIMYSPLGPYKGAPVWPGLLAGLVIMKISLAMDGHREASAFNAGASSNP